MIKNVLFYYMLGTASSNSKRDKYINTSIRVQYRFIFLVFLFPVLFGTRAHPQNNYRLHPHFSSMSSPHHHAITLISN